jgi:hypothetical protein
MSARISSLAAASPAGCRGHNRRARRRREREMGVGGSFWDLLKPYARHEDAGYLHGRRVAVDLSFWIVSHSTAIRARSPQARSPHLRTTFFRTLSLFAKVRLVPSPLVSLSRRSPFWKPRLFFAHFLISLIVYLPVPRSCDSAFFSCSSSLAKIESCWDFYCFMLAFSISSVPGLSI